MRITTTYLLRSSVSSVAVLLIGVALIGLAFEFNPKSTFDRSAPLLFPPKDMKLFSLGYRDMMADVLWLRVLQDIDYCEGGQAAPLAALSKNELVKGEGGPSASKCKQGWVFHMFEAITELAPDFKAPYTYGALSLSVLVVDREGATQLFEKGLKKYPKDPSLAYKAAYHYLFEERNPMRAADLLVQSARNGGPEWLVSLATRIYEKNDQVLLARSVLQEALSNNPNSHYAERLRERLKAIEAAEGAATGSPAGNSSSEPAH
jgi:hypothetical protein